MKKRMFIVRIIQLVLIVCVSGFGFTVDHTHANLEIIPASAITQAAEKLHIVYAHTSHGSQLTVGMTNLVGQTELKGYKGDIYGYNRGGTDGALDLRDHYGNHMEMGGPMIPDGARDLGDSRWDSNTRQYLSENPDINVVMWSWCGSVSYSGSHRIVEYLEKMTALENEYPNITFVYMTGHLDGTGLDGLLHTNNEIIRTYCRDNDKVLYDFADIESYDPDGNYYGNLHVTDGCNYDANGNDTAEDDGDDPALPVNGDRNWAIDWQNSHVEGVDWYNFDYWIPAHTQFVNANMKAYAAWYLFARLGGWVGVDGDSTPPGTPDNLSGVALDKSNVSLSWNSATDPESGVSLYIVYRDGVRVGATSDTTFIDTALSESTSYRYEVAAQNGSFVEGDKSNAITCVTQTDTVPPVITGIVTTNDNELVLSCNKEVDKATAEQSSNYTISNGISVIAAVLSEDERTITLTVSSMQNGNSYVLTAENIQDLAKTPNTIDAGTEYSFTYLNIQTVDVAISEGNDDAEEHTGLALYLTSSDIELVETEGVSQVVGLRFQNIAIPQGATVLSAWLQFTTDESHSGTTTVSICGEAADNASAYESASGFNNISSRSKTSESAIWVPEGWELIAEAGEKQKTPDLGKVVNEIVGRTGWQSGNALSFIITGSGLRTARSFDGNSAEAPRLHIEYTFNSMSTSVQENSLPSHQNVSPLKIVPMQRALKIDAYTIENGTEIQICNLAGQILYKEKLSANKVQYIKTDFLSVGIYVVRIPKLNKALRFFVLP